MSSSRNERNMDCFADLFEIKEVYQIDINLTPPKRKGELAYIQWLSGLSNHLICRLERAEPKRELVSAAEYLEIYNKCLMINQECRAVDALNYLERMVDDLLKKDEHPTDIRLAQLFTGKIHTPSISGVLSLRNLSLSRPGKRKQIGKFCNDPDQKNPWLSTMKAHIVSKRKPGSSIRCLVFASTREVCAALAEWAKATKDLDDLNPDFLTGAGAKGKQKGR